MSTKPEPWDDGLEREARHQAVLLRDHELSSADTDAAWTNFARERMPRVSSANRSGRRARRTRVWVSVAATGLAVAAVTALVWIQFRSSTDSPTEVPTTVTVPVPTTSVLDVVGAPPLTLPAFPDGKLVASLTSVSDLEWFALSNFGPRTGPQSYPQLWHTTDAGVTWVDVALPENVAGGAGRVYFADARNGWLFDHCCLASTHDGGATWSSLNVQMSANGTSGLYGSSAVVTSSGSRVYVIAHVVVGGNSRDAVSSSPIDRDEFAVSGTPLGDISSYRRPDHPQLVVRGDRGWAIAFAATTPPPTDGGSVPLAGAVRLVAGEWTSWDPPCAVSPGQFSASPAPLPQIILGASPTAGTVAVACGPPGRLDGPVRTFVSTDEGDTFAEAAPLPNGVELTEQSWIVLPDEDTILVGAALENGQLVVLRSGDGGRSWATDASFLESGDFTTVAVTPTGRVVVVSADITTNREVAQLRDEDGIWVPLATT